jgi:hypothetical protein
LGTAWRVKQDKPGSPLTRKPVRAEFRRCQYIGPSSAARRVTTFWPTSAWCAPVSRSLPPRSGPGSGKVENKPAVRVLLLRSGDRSMAGAGTHDRGPSVVKSADLPARRPDEEIATLIARSDADGIIRLSSGLTARSVVRRAYEPGAKVWVTDGPFRGFNGAAHRNDHARSRDGLDQHPRRDQAGRDLRRSARSELKRGRFKWTGRSLSRCTTPSNRP